jgi:hypothetical protein
MTEELIGLAAVVMIFGIPITAIVTGHFRKMAELKLQHGEKAESNVLESIRELKEQFTELRDTTTKYDMSFDAALQRIENRVNHLEGRVSRVEQQSDDAARLTQTGGL